MILPKEKIYKLKFTQDGIEKQVTGKAYEQSAHEQLYNDLSCSNELPVTVTIERLDMRGLLKEAGYSSISIEWFEDNDRDAIA